MFLHRRFAIISCLLCQLSLAGQTDNYPFSVDSEKFGDGHRLVARNNGPAPVSVKVAIIDSQYISTDRQFPIYVVVPPGGGTLYLGRIRPAMSGVGYTYRTQYSWMLGDFNSAQSPDASYRLPYRDGTTFRIGQAPGGPITTHNNPTNQYAVDIPMPEGTPILAARDGTVIYTEANQRYGAQVPDMMDKANEVRIQHLDGTIASYVHLAHGGVYVYAGQRVKAGQQIGLAGSTGYSSGPHLHFSVQTVRRNNDKLETISLPFRFFVGTPPVVFPPQFGMLVKADYDSPGTIPGQQIRTQTIQPQPSPQTPTADPSASAKTAMTVTFEVPAEIRSFLVRMSSWTWFAGMLGIVLLLIWFDRTRVERRRSELRTIREPMLRPFSVEESEIHNMGTEGQASRRL